MSDIIVRSVELDDACSILQIYAPYVENTAISFECEIPKLQEFKERIKQITQKFPYLVLCKDGEILGYAYASTFHARAAYNHSVELSIYIRSDCRNCGCGRILYSKLEEELAKKGFLVMYACIAASSRNPDPNLTDDSIKFHEKMGFTNAGYFKNCAKKFGRFYNIVYMQKYISFDFLTKESSILKTDNKDEVVDVYDNQKRISGKTIPRGGFFENNGLLRLVVHVCIFNKSGELLIQQRASTKKTGSNIWDFSVSGQVLAGETSQEGAVRELKEELGVELEIKSAPVFTKIFFNSYNDYYVLPYDCEVNTINYQKEEVQSVKWASREEVLKLRDDNQFLSYPKSLIELVFDIGQGKD